MSSSTTARWSHGSGKPRPDRPRSVAPEAPPRADPALLGAAVEHGLVRTRAALRRHGLAAALLTDPVNIRYTTGTSVMPVFTLHSIDRYLLVPADGEPVLWEYPSAPPELVSPHPGITIRQAISWAAFGRAEHGVEHAARFAAEVVEVLRELGVDGERIGVDRMDAPGFLALQAAGLHLAPAQLAVEQARSVKAPAEIELVRRSVAVCDAAVAALREDLRPGMTENEAWARFTGAAFAAGGEYVECRLLSSGPRTNPWFREASDRVIEPGDLVSFDTDLVGPAGYLADISRTYLVGSARPTDRQRRLYADARAFLAEITGELRVGAAFDELGERLGRRLPAAYHARRYPFIAHGSGLGDEYPVIVFRDHHAGEVEAGTVFSIEAYVGVDGEDEGLKLEEQVLVTADGVELLSHAPHDDRLDP